MATVEQLVVITLSLLVGITVFWLFTVRNSDKRMFGKIFTLGALGWTGAFLLRLVPLSIMQVVALLYLGADFSDPHSVARLAGHPLVTIWGPILAALFEEGTRYFIVLKHDPIEHDTRLGPLTLGLGWSTAEIMIIYGLTILGLTLNPQLQQFSDWSLVLAGGFERLSATTLHVALSFLVFQAKQEQFPQTISLWLAMFFHFTINALIIAWQLVAGPILGEDQLASIWPLEFAIAIVVIGVLAFTIWFWIPRKKRSIITS